MSDTKAARAKSYKFKSEAQQLLDLMIHSLYKQKEIFLRELISNASDALDKLRFESLTQEGLIPAGRELAIWIEADADARTLSVHDSGIGMTRDEAIANLGTIARSGTKEFQSQLKNAATEEGEEGTTDEATAELIGQFGVGFYSSFMVADEVSVLTRRAGEEGATHWSSKGDGRFSVKDAERKEGPGTTVTLHLRPVDEDNGLDDFTQDYRLRTIVKRYSDFVTWPIKLKKAPEPVAESGDDAGAEPVIDVSVPEWETVNSQRAIWTRPASQVEDSEYTEFYKHISHDWNEPLERIRIKAEGTLEYDALLFIPEKAPYDLYYRDYRWGLMLYVNRVLIMERCEELLPTWLRFMRGVVDSPDLSLNVSREMLQQDRSVAMIRKRVIKKTLDALGKLQGDDRERYEKLWGAFGQVLKEGVSTDPANKAALAKLLLFGSTQGNDEALTSLGEYVERMPEGQEAIYYISGESRAAVARSPHLEAFAAKGYEVLFFTDPVDEMLAVHLGDFDGKELASVGRGEVELGDEDERAKAKAEREEKEAEHKSLLEAIRVVLQDEVKEVRLSSRLTDSPACLVGDEGDMSPNLERLLRQAGHDAPEQKRILELNADHAVIQKLRSAFEEDGTTPLVRQYASLLYGQSLLAEGSALPDPVAFSKLVTELMVRSSG